MFLLWKLKNTSQNIIEEEDKKKPLPDDQLAELLKEKGYPIARRTIAKYRATGYSWQECEEDIRLLILYF
jgi:hypothetical protein